jgi:hypothetical protein
MGRESRLINAIVAIGGGEDAIVSTPSWRYPSAKPDDNFIESRLSYGIIADGRGVAI